MTHREVKIARGQCDVRKQESKVREAQHNLEHGYAKAKAEMEREYAKLKAELEREMIELESEKLYLQGQQDNLTDADGDL